MSASDPPARLAQQEWNADIASAPEGVPVMTKIDDERGARNEQPLRKRGRLWWFTDGSMYVYYTPTHWMPLPAPPAPRASREG